MHPVIRIVSFVVLTAFLARGEIASVLVVTALLFVLYLKIDGQAWLKLRRMRWLFLSIAVIYLWLTPGVPLIPGPPSIVDWLPTVDGLWQGSLRAMSLALMVTAASLLLSMTPRDEVLGALRWMMAPLGWLKFPHERFAVRAALCLDAVTRVQTHVRTALAAGGETTGTWARIGTVAAAIFDSVTGEAEDADCAPIVLPEPVPPPVLQWCVPIVLAVLLAGSRQLAG